MLKNKEKVQGRDTKNYTYYELPISEGLLLTVQEAKKRDSEYILGDKVTIRSRERISEKDKIGLGLWSVTFAQGSPEYIKFRIAIQDNFENGNPEPLHDLSLGIFMSRLVLHNAATTRWFDDFIRRFESGEFEIKSEEDDDIVLAEEKVKYEQTAEAVAELEKLKQETAEKVEKKERKTKKK